MYFQSIHSKWLLFASVILVRNQPRQKAEWLLGTQVTTMLIEHAVVVYLRVKAMLRGNFLWLGVVKLIYNHPLRLY
jgi:hypothetical protein